MLDSIQNMNENEMISFLESKDDLYDLGISDIPDKEYDEIKSYALKLYPNNRYFQKVGSSISKDKTKLPVILGSLDKVKFDGSYNKWKSKKTGTKVSWAKLDGVSIYIRYENGKLVFAATRGDGEYGKDITDKAKTFCKKEIACTDTIELRGEVLLVDDTHIDLGYKTRRNGVAGLLNQDQYLNCDKLKVLFYELISCIDTPSTEIERIKYMESLDISLAPYTLIQDEDEEDLSKILKDIKEKSPYDIDGLVISLNDSEREDVFYPENKIAFKVNEQAVPVYVLGIEWNIGRTGRITPTVLLEPTKIQGVTIERATGFNAKFIQTNRIKKGTIVNVVRSGDCIPYIDSVVLED